MRAKILKMSAIGPYAGEVEIDFTGFGRSGIYMITGETGAGKTTIFDGISYALFGSPSGSTRDGKSLRSNYADPDTPTKVSLIFEFMGEEYKIERSPEYMRPNRKKGGAAFVAEKPKAWLYYPSGKVIGDKVRDVDEAIKALIGIDKEQFNRVAMLAQGDFLNLLLAKTDERVDIFRKLFSTENYAALQKAIADDNKEAENRYSAVKAACAETKERSSYKEDIKSMTEEEALIFLSSKTEGIEREKGELTEKKAALVQRAEELNKKTGALLSKREAYLSLESRENELKNAEKTLKNAAENLNKAKENQEKANVLRAKITALDEKKRGLREARKPLKRV